MRNICARVERRSPLTGIGQAIRLTYPDKEGMKSLKGALGGFAHFGRISTEIPARIHCLYGKVILRPLRKTTNGR